MAESGSSEEVRLVLLAQTDDRESIERLLVGVQSGLLRYISGLEALGAALLQSLGSGESRGQPGSPVWW